MRVEKFARKLRELSIDYGLIKHMGDIRYLIGFSGSAGILIVGSGSDAYFFTDRRYNLQSKKEISNAKIFIYEKKALDIIKSAGIFKPGDKIAFDPIHMTYKEYNEYSSDLNGVEFVPVENLLDDISAIKEPDELGYIRRAIEITEKALFDIIQFINPGLSERDIATELDYKIKKLGASGLAFPTIVLSGVNSAFVHGQPSDKIIEYGDLLLIDVGAMYNGYCADITRTFAVGKAKKEAKKLYEIVLSAQKKAIESIREGISGENLDTIAREEIKRAGFGENFQHSIGHGLGMLVHSYPSLSAGVKDELKQGMIVTIEPGIYIEGFGGIRIEDDVLVNTESAEILTKFPKDELMIIG